MIRKVIIVGLTVGAALSAALWVVSEVYSVGWGQSLDEGLPTVDVKLTGGSVELVVWSAEDATTAFRSRSLAWGPFRYEQGGPVTITTCGPVKINHSIDIVVNQALRNLERRYFDGPFATTEIAIALWAPFLLFGAYPVLAFARGPVRRWRRRRKGLCVKCGYDLTGNVSGVCPECGTKVEDRSARIEEGGPG